MSHFLPSLQVHSPSASLESPLTEEAYQIASHLKKQKSIPSDEESAEIAKQQDIKRRFLAYLQTLSNPPISPQSCLSLGHNSSERTQTSEDPLQLQLEGHSNEFVSEEKDDFTSRLAIRRCPTTSPLEPQIRKRSNNKKSQNKRKKAAQLKSGRKTYCLCKQPDGNTFMVRCDGRCNNWYHPVCLGLKESLLMMDCETNPEKKFLCWDCQEEQTSSQ